MTTFVFAILCVAFSVAAQFLLKAGMSNAEVKMALAQPLATRAPLTVFSNLFVLSGFVLYGLGAVAWLRVLSQWDVSKAYPLVGMGFAFTVGIGWLMGEQVTAARVLGVALICAGLVLIGRS